jgi:hypothetical protein
VCCAGLVPCLGYQPHQPPVPSPHQGVERAKDQRECLHSTHLMWGALQLLRACAARRQSRWRAANPRAGLSQAKIVQMCTCPRCEPKCARRRHRDKAVEGTNVRAIGAIHSRSFLTAFVSLAGLGLPSSTALSRTHSDSRSATARPGTPCVHTDRARRVVRGGPGHALPPTGRDALQQAHKPRATAQPRLCIPAHFRASTSKCHSVGMHRAGGAAPVLGVTP